MTVEAYYNPPPIRKEKESDEQYLYRVVDWIQNTEVHGTQEEKKMQRVRREDVPRLLEVGRKLGLSVDDVASAIMLVDGVRQCVEYEMQNMKAQREMAERAEAVRRLPPSKRFHVNPERK